MTHKPIKRPTTPFCISEVLEAAKTGPVTLEVASCARPAPLLNHRPLLRKNPPARVGGIEPPAEVGSGKQSHLGTKRGSDVARICAGPASGCDARALPLPCCRRPSSLPYSYLQRLAELLVARRRCCHPPEERRGFRGCCHPQNRRCFPPAPVSSTGSASPLASGPRSSFCPYCRPCASWGVWGG